MVISKGNLNENLPKKIQKYETELKGTAQN